MFTTLAFEEKELASRFPFKTIVWRTDRPQPPFDVTTFQLKHRYKSLTIGRLVKIFL